ncbi:hypothetical protein CR513_19623, partial [Mucuna pruriens]
RVNKENFWRGRMRIRRNNLKELGPCLEVDILGKGNKKSHLKEVMAGKNDHAIVDTLMALVEVVSGIKGLCLPNQLRVVVEELFRILHLSIICFNYRKQGHMVRNYTIPKKEEFGAGGSSQSTRLKTIGRVFALSGVEASESENLIQGTCFINSYPLIVLFDSRATHSFISHGCTSLPKLLSSLKYDLIIDTLAKNLITTSIIDQPCPDKLFRKIHCLWVSMEDKDERCITANQAEAFLKENAQAYLMLSSLNVEKDMVASDMPIVRDFPEVFPKDVSSFPLKYDIEFSIYLIPRLTSISITPYRMTSLNISSWGAPILLVKKDRSMRLCISYHQLDEVTIRNYQGYFSLYISLSRSGITSLWILCQVCLKPK